MKYYKNISEKYGEQALATISDYQALNPAGTCIEENDALYERVTLKNGDIDEVCVAIKA